jgi:hypothetical protein
LLGSRRRGRLLAGALLRAKQSALLMRRIRLFRLLTGIFEKELLLSIYYLVFSYISGAFPEALVQALFFAAGALFQVLLKLYEKAQVWNNFVLFLFYLAGTLVNQGRNTLGNGLLVFLFVVSCVSALYDRYHPRLKYPILVSLISMAHSAVVFTAFPLLYSLFLLKKKNLSLTTFFEEKEHFLVFLGYSTFYVSVVINKQLLSVQNNLLRKWCLHKTRQDP